MKSNVDNKTELYYNGIAKGYSSLYHNEQINKILKVVNYLPKNGIGIDLGCGDGVLNQFLDINKFDSNNNSNNDNNYNNDNNKNKLILYSMDISEEMLKLNSNLEKYKILGNLNSIPFEDSYFDFSISFSVFQDLSDPILSLKEVNRILKNNGLFIISFVKFSSKKELILKGINKYFNIIKSIEEEKDLIYILKNKKDL